MASQQPEDSLSPAEVLEITHVSRDAPPVVWARAKRTAEVIRWINATELETASAKEIYEEILNSTSSKRQRVVGTTTLDGDSWLVILGGVVPVEPIVPKDNSEAEILKTKIRNSDIMIDGNKMIAGLDGQEIPAVELQEGDMVALQQTGDISVISRAQPEQST